MRRYKSLNDFTRSAGTKSLMTIYLTMITIAFHCKILKKSVSDDVPAVTVRSMKKKEKKRATITDYALCSRE